MATSADLVVRLAATTELLRRELAKGDRAVDDFKRNVDRRLGAIDQRFNRLGGGLKTALAGLAGAGAVRSILQTATALDRANNRFRLVTGSAEAAAREYQFVREQSERLGLELASTAEGYSKLMAASRGTALQGQETRNIFVAVSEGAAVMGLAAEETAAILVALQQMISKNKITAEDFTQQLGERLPGSAQLMARALGLMTEAGEADTAALFKLMATGNLLSEDALPRLAREMHRVFGPEIERAAASTQAQLNRFSNALTELKQGFAQSGFIDGFLSAMNELKDVMSDPAFRSAMTAMGAMIGQLATFMASHAHELALLASIMAGAAAGGRLGAVAGRTGARFGAIGGAIIGGFVAEDQMQRSAAVEEARQVRRTSDLSIGQTVSINEPGGFEGNPAGEHHGQSGRVVGFDPDGRARVEFEGGARASFSGGVLNRGTGGGSGSEISDLFGGTLPDFDASGGAGARQSAYDALVQSMREAREEANLELQYLAATNLEREQQRAILEAQRAAQEDFDNERRASADLSAAEVDAIMAVTAARVADEEAVVRATQSEETLADAKRQMVEESMAAAEAQQEIWDSFGSAVSDAFRDMIIGADSFGEAMSRLAQRMAEVVLQATLLTPLENWLSSSLSGLNLFGGGGGAIKGTPGIGPVMAKAGGGDVMGGVPYLVGERGPEIFMPDTDGFVVSNDNLRRGSGGGMVVAPVFNVDARGADSAAIARLDRSLREVAASIPRQVQATMAGSMVRGGGFSRAVRGG